MSPADQPPAQHRWRGRADRVDLADHMLGEAVRWINERFDVGLRDA